ncbi:MAG: hypothetical protein KKF46_01745 [Nanoarchaeota archaeon]|nr:hypothetical protein [Nanoarchaeota archaeon]MBU1321055.1 hypothetical protein [Nanoarchaeota archaeon]MBU1598124.1 hypothetical protein [Nanoarchaeota archaeon]MBU2442312.1 hypothetical protein [Nanoarchaeota archaeon]
MKNNEQQFDELDELLVQAENNHEKRIVSPKDLIPKKMPITLGAHKKLEMIGPLIKELTGRDYEWSAYFLTQQGDPNYVIRDLLIQKGQDITLGTVKISGDDVAKANNQLEEKNNANGSNLYIIGWPHGHGDARHLGPSSVDMENFETVLNSVSLNTEQHINIPLKLIETQITKNRENGRIRFSGRSVDDAIIEYVLNHDKRLERILKRNGVDFQKENAKDKAVHLLNSLLDTTQINYYQSHIFGFAYYAIMSNIPNIKPYTAIGLSTEKAITKGNSSELIDKVEISKVFVKNDIEVTRQSLEEEIKANIDLPKKWVFVNWKGAKGKKGKYVSVGANAQKWDAQGYYAQYDNHYGGTYQNAFYLSRPFLKTLEGKVNEYEKRTDDPSIGEIKSFVKMMVKLDESYRRDEQMQIMDSYFQSKYGLKTKEAQEREKKEIKEKEENRPEEKVEKKEK